MANNTNSTWLLSYNDTFYDAKSAFAERKQIDWRQRIGGGRVGFSIGDKIYIYSTGSKAIVFLATVIKTDIPKSDIIGDEKFHIDKDKVNKADLYVRIELERTIDNDSLSLEKLRQNGMANPPQGKPHKLDNKLQLKSYIENTLSIISGVDSRITKQSSYDVRDNPLESIVGQQEGGAKQIYTTKYERSAANRRVMVEYYKNKNNDCIACQVCGFDFGKMYGKYGEGFIEVHHIQPLSSYNEVVQINPTQDLVSVCSNCHRMIHRKAEDILTVEYLRQLIKQQ